MVIDEERIILNCYSLAHYFHQSPEVFTEMPYSRVVMHLYYTNRMIASNAAARRDNDA